MFGNRKKRELKTVQIIEPLTVESPSITVNLDDCILKLGNTQHQGKRDYQEDSFGFSDISDNQEAFLAVLADGMGGLSNGKAVSTMVVTRLLEEFNQHTSSFYNSENLLEFLQLLNEEVCSKFCPSGKVEAGSTAVVTMIRNNELFWVCIGDSRIYLKRSGKLYQINEDHDLLNQLLKAVISDKISVEEAFDNIKKDSLVSCIGNINSEKYDYNLIGFPLMAGDQLLLCSDGVYNGITEEEISKYITDNPITSVQNIQNAVLSKNFKNQDNLTAIIIKKEN